jgi:hypothetical protein
MNFVGFKSLKYDPTHGRVSSHWLTIVTPGHKSKINQTKEYEMR